MTLQLAMYYMSSHASAQDFLIMHGSVIKLTLTGLQQYSQDLTQGDLESP